MNIKQVSLLGATGSIGASTLDIIRRHPDQFSLYAASAHSDIQGLLAICVEFSPEVAVIGDEQSAKQLSDLLASHSYQVEVCYGATALSDMASVESADLVVAAIVGGAGLAPCLAAAKAGKTILLANKEALVMSGQLFLDQVRINGARILPLDSEHNAMFQSLPTSYQKDFLNLNIQDYGVNSIVLTGSGGPFLTTPLNELSLKTPEQACKHPNWDMGRKISVDSATMMNKGLEFIEACYLFSVEPSFIEVVVHPQSVIHSMIRYTDGSILCQMGAPDMRTPIACAMAWPDRIECGVEPYDFLAGSHFTFEQPEPNRYKNLYLAKEAFAAGQEMTTVLNAANEVHVQAFLDGRIQFTDIALFNQRVLDESDYAKALNLDDIFAIDQLARAGSLALLTSNQRG